MGEALLVALALVAAFVVIAAASVHGKARAFLSGACDRPARRSAEGTGVELPPPQFNRRDADHRRGKFAWTQR